MGIVPALDEVKDRHACLNLSFETAALEQLAFQGGEKALRHRVVETIAETEPIEGRTPACWQRVPNAIEVY